MANANTYAARLNIANPTASTTLPVLQINASGTKPFEILRVAIDQETSTTSGVTAVELVRATTTAPGTLTPSLGSAPIAYNPSDATAGSVFYTGGFAGALTGAQTTIKRWGFNVLNGLVYLPVPEERIVIAAATFFWVRLPVTVPAATYNILVTYCEWG